MKWDFLRERIQKLCDDTSITLKDLCFRTNIKYTTLLSFMSGDSKTTSLDNIQAISAYFDVALDYLMREEVTDPKYKKTPAGLQELSSTEIELIGNYRIAASEDQLSLLRFAALAAQTNSQSHRPRSVAEVERVLVDILEPKGSQITGLEAAQTQGNEHS